MNTTTSVCLVNFVLKNRFFSLKDESKVIFFRGTKKKYVINSKQISYELTFSRKEYTL